LLRGHLVNAEKSHDQANQLRPRNKPSQVWHTHTAARSKKKKEK